MNKAWAGLCPGQPWAGTRTQWSDTAPGPSQGSVLMVQKSFLGAAGTLFIPGSGTEAFDVPWQVGVAWGGLLEPSYQSLALPWDSHL